ncbi:MAG TPA: hypothetical protein VMA31_17235 [Bryobacteraceae bacterium]|nr:hypothetical protein [Bryobacteraceae bacterium]
MSDSPFEDSNRIGAEFLITDLDIALTFLDVAQISANEETIRRNRAHARRAYDTVLHLLTKLEIDARQRQTIGERLSKLKARLEAVGYRF